MHRRIDRSFFSLPLLRSLALTLALMAAGAEILALEYPTNTALEQQLKKLQRSHERLVRLQSIVKTVATNDVWFLEIGAGNDGDRTMRPAFLLVAGIEGNDLAGTVSAVAWLEQLASGYATNEAIKKLLDTTTIYVFPRLNPDATQRFFATPKLELAVNGSPVDDDHDGLSDEDGPDDLDSDGLITWMRVKDPTGEYILDPKEPRLLIKADRAKGEKGEWRLLTEGRDNDGDEQWNEDGPGGVNFNRNFPYNYRYFGNDAGRHQVSEPETRALADFIVEHPNVGIAFTFGAADNLVALPRAASGGGGAAPGEAGSVAASEEGEGRGGRRPATGVGADDMPYYRELGKAFRDALGLKRELGASSESGTFSDWMYFHRGRLSVAAKPWSPALQLELAKPAASTEQKKEGEEAKPDEAKKDDPEAKPQPARPAPEGRRGRGAAAPSSSAPAAASTSASSEEDRNFLKWLDTNAPNSFVAWKAFDHPDFPGKTVEIGGFAPFAKTNPSEKLLDALAAKHARFLTELAGKLPRVGIRKSEVKHLGESVYDITVQVENTGYLPTVLAHGVTTREVHPTRVILKVDDQAILSGRRTVALGPIEGSGGMREVRWIVLAKGQSKLEVEVVSMLAGTVNASIDLK
jgi:hypothetical protein